MGCDNITFYDAAGKTLAEKPIFMRTVSEDHTPAQQKLFERIGSKLKAPAVRLRAAWLRLGV